LFLIPHLPEEVFQDFLNFLVEMMELNPELLPPQLSRKKHYSEEIAIIAVNQHHLGLIVHIVMAFIVQTIDYQRNIIVQEYTIVEKFLMRNGV
jgi:hypothetical protein